MDSRMRVVDPVFFLFFSIIRDFLSSSFDDVSGQVS